MCTKPHHINIGYESHTDSHRSGIIGYVLHELSANLARNYTGYRLGPLGFVSIRGSEQY